MPKPTGPLRFSPILKQIIWGGRRLGERLKKPIGAASDYAESWELVDRAADQSIVQDGPLAGSSLGELLAKYNAEILGRHAGLAAFPLLIKYLDCNRVLSVQVHPDDQYARQMPTPDLGKTEVWYIVDATPDSVIYAGLKSGVDRRALAEAVRQGRTDEVLHTIRPQAGQCIFIPAGTVHALGDGLLVAEIQQSSDTTFRLFDWNRTDPSGKPRALHIDQALDVTDYERGPIQPQVPQPAANGWENLVFCEKFRLRQTASHAVTGCDDAAAVLMVTNGRARLEGNGWDPIEVECGETVLVPASSGPTQIVPLANDLCVLEAVLP